jgi:hypothetical protein
MVPVERGTGDGQSVAGTLFADKCAQGVNSSHQLFSTLLF